MKYLIFVLAVFSMPLFANDGDYSGYEPKFRILPSGSLQQLYSEFEALPKTQDFAFLKLFTNTVSCRIVRILIDENEKIQEKTNSVGIHDLIHEGRKLRFHEKGAGDLPDRFVFRQSDNGIVDGNQESKAQIKVDTKNLMIYIFYPDESNVVDHIFICDNYSLT